MILEVPTAAAASFASRRNIPVHSRWLHIVLLFAIIVMTGCTGLEPAKPSKSLASGADLGEEFNKDTALGRSSEPSVITLGIGDALKERLASEGEELPVGIFIDSTNLNSVPVAAALQAVLADTNISLSWQAGQFDDRLVTILNLSGPLPKVVERICSAARVYCSYRNGTLELMERETFIIEMPPIPGEAENTIADTIAALAGGGEGAGEVNVDTQGGNIVYTTDMAGQMRVKQYLSQLRRGRPLIMMQVFIWEVTLNEESETGIKWNADSLGDFNIGGSTVSPLSNSGITDATLAAAKGAFTSLPGNISFGAVFSGTIDAAAVLAFLKHNGHVETVSNPQLTFVSGTRSEFTIGGKRSYISGVGQLVGSTVSSGGTSNNTGVGTNTVQTEEIETGLSVKMSGAYESGVIFGELEMEDTSLVDLERIPSSGTEIQLPITQERQLKTVLRLRPGDTMLLAGLRSQRNVSDRAGLPTLFGLVPTSARNETENRELVVMLRPAIIRFTDALTRDGDRSPSKEMATPMTTLDTIETVPDVPPPEVLQPMALTPSPVPASVEVLPPRPAKALSGDSLQRTFDDVYNNARRRPQTSDSYGGGGE
ncbi:MAG: type II secretion system protein GspD [Bdellovibrionales bacterium]